MRTASRPRECPVTTIRTWSADWSHSSKLRPRIPRFGPFPVPLTDGRALEG